MEYPLVIVGAGPCGATAALEAARLGISPVLLLDKAVFPRHKTCAGGLSPRAMGILGELGLWDELKPRCYGVIGMHLTSPNGKRVSLAGAEAAFTMPRLVFDDFMVQKARAAGAEFRVGKAEELLFQDGRCVGVRCGDERISARHVLLAGGNGLRLPGAAEGVIPLDSCMAWFDGLPFDPGMMEMYFDPAFKPNYAWLFPESPTRVNIGLCMPRDRLGSASIRTLFDAFLKKYFAERLPKAKADGPWRGFPLHCRTTVRMAGPRGVLVGGEAAGLVNLATGEGISQAMLSGQWAARAVHGALANGYDDRRTAAFYQASVRKALRLDLAAGRAFDLAGQPILNLFTNLGNLKSVRYVAAKVLGRM